MAMKILLLIMAQLLNFSSFASIKKVPILQEKAGKILYYVSESNRSIHVVFPMKVNLSLIEIDKNSKEDRYSLIVNGEQGDVVSGTDLQPLKMKYPGYKITKDLANSFSVVGCEFKLPGGRNVECMIPPASASGNYFSIFEPLSKTEGDQLKESLTKGPEIKLSALKVTVRHLAPYVDSRSVADVNYQKFYESLGSSSVTLKDLILKIGMFLADQPLVNQDEELKSKVITALMENCVGGNLQLNGVMSLNDFLATGLTTNRPRIVSQSVLLERLGWMNVQSDADFDITLNNNEGVK